MCFPISLTFFILILILFMFYFYMYLSFTWNIFLNGYTNIEDYNSVIRLMLLEKSVKLKWVFEPI